MPVYANTSGFVGRGRHPKALMLIIGGHAALVAVVMMAKMEVIPPILTPPTVIDFIDPPKPPSPEPKPNPEPKPRVEPRNSSIDQPEVKVPLPTNTGETKFDDVPLPPEPPNAGPIGTGEKVIETLTPKPPVFVAGRFNTPERLIKPPYPAGKQRLEEEAVLRLKLSVDERGRVIAVEPVGRVDRSFFEAARKHLIANWRYRPATEDGKAVPWSTIISLTFRIE